MLQILAPIGKYYMILLFFYYLARRMNRSLDEEARLEQHDLQQNVRMKVKSSICTSHIVF
jgi:hypothetical protein